MTISKTTTIRLLAVASGGGHWVQLLRLRPAFAGCCITYVSTFEGLGDTAGDSPIYIVRDASQREKLGLLMLAVQLIFVLLKVRPHVVVTTGAAPGFLAVSLGKLFGARALWIDSIANGEEMSMAGKLVIGRADLCLTQWPHVADNYEGVEYRGAVV